MVTDERQSGGTAEVPSAPLETPDDGCSPTPCSALRVLGGKCDQRGRALASSSAQVGPRVVHHSGSEHWRVWFTPAFIFSMLRVSPVLSETLPPVIGRVRTSLREVLLFLLVAVETAKPVCHHLPMVSKMPKVKSLVNMVSLSFGLGSINPRSTVLRGKSF